MPDVSPRTSCPRQLRFVLIQPRHPPAPSRSPRMTIHHSEARRLQAECELLLGTARIWRADASGTSARGAFHVGLPKITHDLQIVINSGYQRLLPLVSI
jgi:hypothetical protein